LELALIEEVKHNEYQNKEKLHANAGVSDAHYNKLWLFGDENTENIGKRKKGLKL
jgi:hypothetical protein